MCAQMHCSIGQFDANSSAAVLWGLAKMTAAGGRAPGVKFTTDFAEKFMTEAGKAPAGPGPLARALWGAASLGFVCGEGWVAEWEARAAEAGWAAFSYECSMEVAQAYDIIKRELPGELVAALASQRAVAEAGAAAAAARRAQIEAARADARKTLMKRAALEERRARIDGHRESYRARRAAKAARSDGHRRRAAGGGGEQAEGGNGEEGAAAAAAAGEGQRRGGGEGEEGFRRLKQQMVRNRQHGYNQYTRKYRGGFGGAAAAAELGSVVIMPEDGGGSTQQQQSEKQQQDRKQQQGGSAGGEEAVTA
jgi:hypothetical protein